MRAMSSPIEPAALQASVDVKGYAIAHRVFPAAAMAAIVGDLGDAYAMRNLLRESGPVREAALAPPLIDLARCILGPDARPVKATLFDKTPDANWKVAWHQDQAIAVRRRVDVPGFGPWSVKAGVPHVRPPVSVLEHMIALRIHLDDCGADNGALCVVPGSHRFGLLGADASELLRAGSGTDVCAVNAGDVLLMRPLILHRSSQATAPTHRRVIHIEYAAVELAGGLEWADLHRSS